MILFFCDSGRSSDHFAIKKLTQKSKGSNRIRYISVCFRMSKTAEICQNLSKIKNWILATLDLSNLSETFGEYVLTNFQLFFTRKETLEAKVADVTLAIKDHVHIEKAANARGKGRSSSERES